MTTEDACGIFMRTARSVALVFALSKAATGTRSEVYPFVESSQEIRHTLPGSSVSLNTSCFSFRVRDTVLSYLAKLGLECLYKGLDVIGHFVE